MSGDSSVWVGKSFLDLFTVTVFATTLGISAVGGLMMLATGFRISLDS